jgi:hypothetical protein
MEEPIKIIAAAQGTFILNNTTAITGKFDGIVILEETIIEYIEIDGLNVTTEYIADPLISIKIGAIIRPKNPASNTQQTRFTKIKLTSGSAAIIL